MTNLIVEITISAILGSITTLLGVYVIINHLRNIGYFTEILEEMVDEVADNEDLMKKLYIIGGTLGSGARSGLGITTKGKLKWQDLALQLGQQWIQQRIGLTGDIPEQNQKKIPNRFKL